MYMSLSEYTVIKYRTFWRGRIEEVLQFSCNFLEETEVGVLHCIHWCHSPFFILCLILRSIPQHVCGRDYHSQHQAWRPTLRMRQWFQLSGAGQPVSEERYGHAAVIQMWCESVPFFGFEQFSHYLQSKRWRFLFLSEHVWALLYF